MGVIKINNIIYGSNNSADIIYKNTTVEEKLNSIPIFDINDNGNVPIVTDILTYGHIVDNLSSDSNSLILSAKQGKILNERIDIIEEKMTDNEVIDDLNNRVTENTNDISELNGSLTYLNNNTVFYNSATDCIDVYSNGVLIGSIATGIKDPVKLTPILTQDNGKVLCRTEAADLGYNAWKVFDGIKNLNAASLWISVPGSGTTLSDYIGYNFDTNRTVLKFKIYNRASGSNSVRAIKNFKLQGSNNKTDWYDIQSYVNPSTAFGACSEFYVDTPQTFKMFRLYISSAYEATSGDTRACLAEVEFYGY